MEKWPEVFRPLFACLPVWRSFLHTKKFSFGVKGYSIVGGLFLAFLFPQPVNEIEIGISFLR